MFLFANVIPTCNINVTHHPPNRHEGRLPHDARRVDRDTAKVRTLASNSDSISFVSSDRRARVYSKCRHPFRLTTDNFVGGISYTEHMPRIDQTGPILGYRWGNLIIKILNRTLRVFCGFFYILKMDSPHCTCALLEIYRWGFLELKSNTISRLPNVLLFMW